MISAAAARALAGILKVPRQAPLLCAGTCTLVGGIVPDGDARRLREMGVQAVFTPKDYGITEIMREMVEIVRDANGLPRS